MSIAAITGQGLSAIALSVALLWGCFIGEQLLIRNAMRDMARVKAELRILQRWQRTQPVSAPVLRPFHRARPGAG
jgi:hypothetical protein